MQLQLANDEKIIKDWTYASYKEEKETTVHNLTVTNKRVIISEKSENEISRSELMVDNVVGVTAEYAKNQSRPNRNTGIVLIVIGAALLIAAIILVSTVNAFAGIGLFVLSAVLLIIGFVFLFRKNHAEMLSVVIQTNVPTGNTSYNIYTNTFRLPKNLIASTVTVAVNIAVAEEIVDTIGALIVAKGAQA